MVLICSVSVYAVRRQCKIRWITRVKNRGITALIQGSCKRFLTANLYKKNALKHVIFLWKYINPCVHRVEHDSDSLCVPRCRDPSVLPCLIHNAQSRHNFDTLQREREGQTRYSPSPWSSLQPEACVSTCCLLSTIKRWNYDPFHSARIISRMKPYVKQ